jgi:hypothetical protein
MLSNVRGDEVLFVDVDDFLSLREVTLLILMSFCIFEVQIQEQKY